VQTRCFDTYADSGHSTAMAQFINTLPHGRMVLVGVKGTVTPATGLFGGGVEPEGVRALIYLGFPESALEFLGFRASIAFIGNFRIRHPCCLVTNPSPN